MRIRVSSILAGPLMGPEETVLGTRTSQHGIGSCRFGMKDYLTNMETTVTLSSKGQLAMPKHFREEDQLVQSDVFRLERLGPGRYLLERMAPPKRPKAALVRSPEGFLVFRPPRGARPIPSDLVKQLEAETP